MFGFFTVAVPPDVTDDGSDASSEAATESNGRGSAVSVFQYPMPEGWSKVEPAFPSATRGFSVGRIILFIEAQYGAARSEIRRNPSGFSR